MLMQQAMVGNNSNSHTSSIVTELDNVQQLLGQACLQIGLAGTEVMPMQQAIALSIWVIKVGTSTAATSDGCVPPLSVEAVYCTTSIDEDVELQ